MRKVLIGLMAGIFMMGCGAMPTSFSVKTNDFFYDGRHYEMYVNGHDMQEITTKAVEVAAYVCNGKYKLTSIKPSSDGLGHVALDITFECF